jgi:hypothetical protein
MYSGIITEKPRNSIKFDDENIFFPLYSICSKRAPIIFFEKRQLYKNSFKFLSQIENMK